MPNGVTVPTLEGGENYAFYAIPISSLFTDEKEALKRRVSTAFETTISSETLFPNQGRVAILLFPRVHWTQIWNALDERFSDSNPRLFTTEASNIGVLSMFNTTPEAFPTPEEVAEAMEEVAEELLPETETAADVQETIAPPANNTLNEALRNQAEALANALRIVQEHAVRLREARANQEATPATFDDLPQEAATPTPAPVEAPPPPRNRPVERDNRPDPVIPQLGTPGEEPVLFGPRATSSSCKNLYQALSRLLNRPVVQGTPPNAPQNAFTIHWNTPQPTDVPGRIIKVRQSALPNITGAEVVDGYLDGLYVTENGLWVIPQIGNEAKQPMVLSILLREWLGASPGSDELHARFWGYVSDSMGLTLAELDQGQLIDLMEEIQNLSARALRAAREQKELEQQLATRYQDYQSLTAPDKARTRQIIEKLRDVAGVAGVKIQGQILHLFTERVVIHHTHSEYHEPWVWDLGTFDIRVDMRTKAISIHSLDYAERNGNKHPHVSGTSPCFGHIGNEVSQLSGRGDWFNLAQLLVAYIQTYNPQSPYRNLEGFDDDRGRPVNGTRPNRRR